MHVFLDGKTNDRIDEHFDHLSFGNPIPPGQTSSGILFTNPQPAPKVLNVDLLGNHALVPFTLFLPVPGYPDVSIVESLHSYPESAVTDHDDLGSLRNALQQLPCCAVRASDGGPAEPLNAVFVGSYENIASAAARRGYRRVQTDEGVGQLAFGRPPDAVAVKRAQAGAPSNWVRLWSVPVRLQGQPVFVAQVGRPVGGRFLPEESNASATASRRGRSQEPVHPGHDVFGRAGDAWVSSPASAPCRGRSHGWWRTARAISPTDCARYSSLPPGR